MPSEVGDHRHPVPEGVPEGVDRLVARLVLSPLDITDRGRPAQARRAMLYPSGS